MVDATKLVAIPVKTVVLTAEAARPAASNAVVLVLIVFDERIQPPTCVSTCWVKSNKPWGKCTGGPPSRPDSQT